MFENVKKLKEPISEEIDKQTKKFEFESDVAKVSRTAMTKRGGRITFKYSRSNDWILIGNNYFDNFFPLTWKIASIIFQNNFQTFWVITFRKRFGNLPHTIRKLFGLLFRNFEITTLLTGFGLLQGSFEIQRTTSPFI